MIYFRGKSHFKEDGTQSYSLFKPMYRYFKKVVNSNHILEWKSKGFSDEIIRSPSTPHNVFNPSINYLGTRTWVGFSGSCLK